MYHNYLLRATFCHVLLAAVRALAFLLFLLCSSRCMHTQLDSDDAEAVQNSSALLLSVIDGTAGAHGALCTCSS